VVRTTRAWSSTNNNYAVGFDVAWEADLFGRLGDARRAAQANVLAGAAGMRAAQVSVSAEVARNYFDLRGLQEQLRVAVASLETQQAALELVDARFDVGRGTALDSERARALVQVDGGQYPGAGGGADPHPLSAGGAVRPAADRAGRGTGAGAAVAGIARSVQLAGIGSPASLLRRRPDIQVAEAQVAAAAAQVGVARSALFPQLTLGGTLGQNSCSSATWARARPMSTTWARS
jgi:multidrug efflux system outer membrane protein